MTEDQMRSTLEERNMHIKHLERSVKELTRQNYDLIVRISELGDELRSLRRSLDSFTEL